MKKLSAEKLEELVALHAEQELAEQKIAGKEILVHQDGKCVLHRVFGCEAAGGRKLKKGQMYRIASMTKPVTGTAVMQLIEQGRLSLQTPVSDFFPALKTARVGVMREDKLVSLVPLQGVITVENLLNHTGGIDCAPVNAVQGDITHNLSLAQAAEQYTHTVLSFHVNTATAYSRTGAFDIAAAIVEKISGMPFDAYVKKHIFDPVGMADTTFTPTQEQYDRMVAIFNRTPEGEGFNDPSLPGCVFENYAATRQSAGAGLASTASDYIRFADMLLFGGMTANGVRILQEGSVRNMSTPHVSEKIMPGDTQWGLSMRVITKPEYPYGLPVGAFGWSGRYGTHFWVDPVNRITAVSMKNSTYDGGSNNLSGRQLEQDVADSLIE